LRRRSPAGVEVVLGVVGRDDIFCADVSNPPPTTLTAPIRPAGRVAMAMLLSGQGNRPREALRRNAVLPT
jgi:DNA-binding LacI/PurR family transcriptional regulator